MQHAPLPTDEQLERVREAIGASSLVHSYRIEAGLSCTMDVLSDGGTRLVLRRYGEWSHARGEDAALRETRALELMQRANIPAPAPIWIDRENIFDEQAMLISFVDGAPDLIPANPFEWAEKLAGVLTRIHEIRLDDSDLELFPPGAGEDVRRIDENPEWVLEHPLGEDLLRRRVTLGGQSVEEGSVFSHTDFWPGNVMWDRQGITGVVDWESPATGDRSMDVAYCSLDIRYLGMDRVADRFVEAYRAETGDQLVNFSHWESIALCRPMPDIAQWVPTWVAMGRDISVERARETYTRVLEEFLKRTA